MSLLSTDIYSVKEAMDDLKSTFIPEEDSETLELGLYGFISSALSKMIASNIKIAAEQGNEMFANRARLQRNIISHAVANNITDLNATPASMDIIFCIVEDDLEALFESQGGSTVTIDRACPFTIGEYEYHLDYPIIISKASLSTGKSVYTARYDMSDANELSDIENPYLESPYVMKYNEKTYVYFACLIRQVSIVKNIESIITDNSIDNKTYEFTYENQLASFRIYANDGSTTSRIYPLLEGEEPSTELYCRYYYLDDGYIRVKFDSDSYIPTINTEITTEISTTLGDECAFEYTDNLIFPLEDTDDYSYNGVELLVIPQTASSGGVDQISKSALKKLVTQEAMSRGNLTSEADLNNYFNKLNTTDVKLDFRKKVENQYMMQYYAYILTKDSDSNIVPTNTIDVIIKESELETAPDSNEDTLICKQGICLGCNMNDSYATVISDTSDDNLAKYDFVYTLPFKGIIDKSVPAISYHVTMMNNTYKTYFQYINDGAPLQFICANAKWYRPYTGDNKNKYTLTFTITQNIPEDNEILIPDNSEVPKDPLNKLTTDLGENNLVCVVVCYKNGIPFRYFTSSLQSYDLSTFTYTETVTFKTSDIIDSDNNVRITGGYPAGSDTKEYGYMDPNTEAYIYILARFKDDYGNYKTYGQYGLDSICTIEGIENFTVTNIYKITDGIDFYDNFSDTVTTTITSTKLDGENAFKLASTPVIKYKYALNETKLMNFINTLKKEKEYIDNALEILEQPFGIDMKFFNTYGQSRLFTADDKYEIIDKVNISPKFRVALQKSSDNYTIEYIKRDIKSYFEDISNVNVDYHIPNLIAQIYQSYSNSIYYIEFRGYNDYGTDYNHLYAPNDTSIGSVPEFININITDDDEPDITISQLS